MTLINSCTEIHLCFTFYPQVKQTPLWTYYTIHIPIEPFYDGQTKGFTDFTERKGGRHILWGSTRCRSGRQP